MRIKKIGQSTPVTGQIIDSLSGSSTTNAPSIRAVNEALNDVQRLTNVTYNSKMSATAIWKIGRLVIIDFNVYISEAVSSNEVLISGLPASIGHFSGISTTDLIPEISTNQTQIVSHGSMTTGYKLGTLIYITAN